MRYDVIVGIYVCIYIYMGKFTQLALPNPVGIAVKTTRQWCWITISLSNGCPHSSFTKDIVFNIRHHTESYAVQRLRILRMSRRGTRKCAVYVSTKAPCNVYTPFCIRLRMMSDVENNVLCEWSRYGVLLSCKRSVLLVSLHESSQGAT